MHLDSEVHLSMEERDRRYDARRNELRRKRRQHNKANGLCAECKEKAVPGKTLCKDHLERHRLYCRTKRMDIIHEKKRDGICTYSGCHNEAIEGRSMCDYHDEMIKERRDERYHNNLCDGKCRCGRPVKEGIKDDGTEYTSCPRCIKSKAEYVRRSRAKKRAMLLSKEGSDAK